MFQGLAGLPLCGRNDGAARAACSTLPRISPFYISRAELLQLVASCVRRLLLLLPPGHSLESNLLRSQDLLPGSLAAARSARH